MKICIMSDTHLSSSKYSKMDKNRQISRFMERQFLSLEWIKNYLKQEDITNIIHCGDVFDSVKLNPYPIKRTKDIFNDFFVYAIKGNHDDNSFLHDEKISAIDLLGINSISSPCSEEIGGVNFVFVPWGFDIPEELIFKGKKNILITHGFIRDSVTDELFLSNDIPKGAISTKIASKFDLVIAGHYHTPGEFSYKNTRFLIPGSLSSTGNSVNFDPSIWILDTCSLEYKMVPIINAVKTIKCSPEDVNSFLSDIKGENVYRIESKEIPDKIILSKAKKIALEIQLKIVDKNNENLSDKSISNFWSYTKKYKPSYVNDFKSTLASLERLDNNE